MLGVIVQDWCPWCDTMHWGGGFMMLSWILLLIIVVAVVWILAQRGGWTGGRGGLDRAEETLRERYARGEIDEVTYRRMLDELRR